MKKIDRIAMREWEHSIKWLNGFSFVQDIDKQDDGLLTSKVISLSPTMYRTEEENMLYSREYADLTPEQKIVGVYGYFNLISQLIWGLGFIVSEPEQVEEADLDAVSGEPEPATLEHEEL